MSIKNSAFFNKTFDNIFNNFVDQSIPIMYASVTDNNNLTVPLLASKGDISQKEEFRDDEVTAQLSSVNDNEYTIQFYFNNRQTAVLGAWLGICRTIFVCVILTVSILKLSKDSEELVINPLQAMLQKVNRISKNPLDAAELEEAEAVKREELKKTNKAKWLELQEQSNYEPSVLEKIIIKIGTLLAIGFGEAGSEIIAKNMALSTQPSNSQAAASIPCSTERKCTLFSASVTFGTSPTSRTC